MSLKKFTFLGAKKLFNTDVERTSATAGTHTDLQVSDVDKMCRSAPSQRRQQR
jgi:hypothetical protein